MIRSVALADETRVPALGQGAWRMGEDSQRRCEAEVVEFDLRDLARGVVAAYEPLAAKKALAFEFDVAEEVRGRYLGDSARIRQILYSLADNAVKFTETGGVTLRVERDAEHVVFRLTDTGVGIAQDDLAHLFEGFFQADSTLTRRYGGTGIGLAICGQLATLMGGVLEASSKLGEGSPFTLRLPLKLAEAMVDSRTSETPSREPEPTAELPVLAAEDNATNQLVLKTLLAAAGVEPTIVVNGCEVLATWESQTWDVVLMDIQMPEMNGIEATRAIRYHEQQTGRSRTPIVAVTANAMTHQVAEYEVAGMDGVAAKPIDVANLFSAMERVLAQAAAPRPSPIGRTRPPDTGVKLNVGRRLTDRRTRQNGSWRTMRPTKLCASQVDSQPDRFSALCVDDIEAAGAADHLYVHRNDLRSLNEFSRPGHHRGTSPPDPTELRAQCRKIVKIIGSY